MTVNVTVTERAARRIGEILRQEPAGTMLRVSVEGGGCSGFQYKFDTERERTEDDIVIEKSGATVLIDPISLNYMVGSEIDFVDDLIGSSFKVNNPKATASCGCGTSFAPLVRTSANLRANRHLECEFDQAAARCRGDLACRAPARHRLSARNQMRRRRVSARAVRGARLQCRRARAKDIQRRRFAVEISVRRSQHRPAGRRSGRPCPFHRSGRLDRAWRDARRQPFICRTAIRPETDKYTYKIGWMKRLSSLCARTPAP